jgi:uncharacterized protein YcaQ
MTLRISAPEARRLALHLQGLSGPPRRSLPPDRLLELIERIGFVQVDSINTVERAHHMILFARGDGYQAELLRRLLEDEVLLFEHWTHNAAAILPMRFYPYWKVRFERERSVVEQRFRRWHGDGFQDDVDRLLAQIRERGPVMARDLAPERVRQAGGWWSWHAGKTALEFLWRTGRLAIARRRGFQKVYDLAERVIPDEVRAVEPSHEAFVDWACRSALERLGFASPSEIARFFGLLTIEEAKAWCASHLGDGVVAASVETSDGAAPSKIFARSDLASHLQSAPEPGRRLRALSPFDPILRARARVSRLFGFDYRIEVFVPAARRRYGYYVFPLLEGDGFIGRIDMKASRGRGTLDVQGLWMEPGRRLTAARRTRLEAELDRIRRFAGLDAVRFADGFLQRDG